MKSYKDFLQDISNFKRAGGFSSDEFNLYDTPSHKYFRIFFHFWNGDSLNVDDSTGTYSGGLLAPTWELTEDPDEIWKYSSAYSYLITNNELERADMLKDFIELLSNISTKSPWYFNQVIGLGDALERKQVMESEFKFEESRKKITIKCLPDAYDNRISSLLDLYRAVVWSWQMKRMILPSNLRKFDMSIYIFESPIANICKQLKNVTLSGSRTADDSSYATIDSQDTNHYITSSKYIEFHNCEIDYNSTKSGYPEINQEGYSPEFSIDILFDDCYESQYNEFLMKDIGDMIEWDADYRSKYQPLDAQIKSIRSNNFDNRANVYKSDIFTELGGFGSRFINRIINKIKLGNLYTFSLSNLKDQISLMNEGHLFSTIGSTRKYLEDNKKAKMQYVKQIGNLFSAKSTISNI